MSQSEDQTRVESRRRVAARIAVEAVYSRLARPYDFLSDILYMGQGRAWQRSMLPFVQGPRVLEIGMGTGWVQMDLLQDGYDTFGIDFSLAMMKQANRKARKAGAEPLKICRAQAQSLPFPDESFNTVVSTFGSEYLTSLDTYTEVARVLVKSGRVVIVPGGRLRHGERSRAIRHLPKSLFSGRKRMAKEANYVQQMRIEPYPGDPAQAAAWVFRIHRYMEASRLAVSMYVGQNSRSTTLIIVGDKVD